MSTNRVTTTAALLAALALVPWPARAQEAVERREGSAQEARRQNRQQGRQDGQARGENRRAPRGDTNGGGNRVDRGARDNSDAASRGSSRADRGTDRNDTNNRGNVYREAVPRADRRDNDRRDDDRNRGYRDNGYRDRDRNWNRGGRYLPRPNYNRYSRPPRVYVVPYGYRPGGYRPGWSTNLYFGRPFGGYYNRYPGYYGNGYGYFDIPSGFVYGSVRIVDAPRDARVFVDGYYAGVVDDYDGVFQRLNVEPGSHYIELDVYPGAPPLQFDVYVEPGRTLTIHARP